MSDPARWVVTERMVPFVDALASSVALLECARGSERFVGSVQPGSADVVAAGLRQAEGLLYLVLLPGRS